MWKLVRVGELVRSLKSKGFRLSQKLF